MLSEPKGLPGVEKKGKRQPVSPFSRLQSPASASHRLSPVEVSWLQGRGVAALRGHPCLAEQEKGSAGSWARQTWDWLRDR